MTGLITILINYFMKNILKTNTKEDLIVKWEPDKCIHSGICFQGLPSVFNPGKKPWVNMDGAQMEEILNQVKACPSGALSLMIG